MLTSEARWDLRQPHNTTHVSGSTHRTPLTTIKIYTSRAASPWRDTPDATVAREDPASPSPGDSPSPSPDGVREPQRLIPLARSLARAHPSLAVQRCRVARRSAHAVSRSVSIRRSLKQASHRRRRRRRRRRRHRLSLSLSSLSLSLSLSPPPHCVGRPPCPRLPHPPRRHRPRSQRARGTARAAYHP